MTYQQTIRNLFKILKCNTTVGGAWSVSFKDYWVHKHDVFQWELRYKTLCLIREIAGEDIVNHWENTGKVSIKLARQGKK